MRVVLLEDDPLQVRSLNAALEGSFKDLSIRAIGSEQEFYSQMEDLRRDPPDLFLLDVMVRWAAVGEAIENPPSAPHEEGFFRAGLRCLDAILATTETSRIPTIIYSVVAREDYAARAANLPPHVLMLQKDSDDARLIRQIRSLLQAPPEASRDTAVGDRLWESVGAKPGLFGFSFDLKPFLVLLRERLRTKRSG